MECHYCQSQAIDIGYPRPGTGENLEVRSCKCYNCGGEWDKVTYLPEPTIIPTKLPGGTDINIWTIQYGRAPWDKQPIMATVHTDSQELVEMIARTIVVQMGDITRECRYFKGTNPLVSAHYVHLRTTDTNYQVIANKMQQKSLWEDDDG
jgi:hypothetical protein